MGARGPKLTYANVMSTIAVVAAIGGGTAWAVATIGSGDIERNAVRSKHIKKNQVKGKDVKESSLKGVDADELDGRDSEDFASSAGEGYVPIALGSFIDCTDNAGGRLNFDTGNSDSVPDLFNNAADGQGYTIFFDNDPGFTDEDTRICAEIQIPPDYASGGSLVLGLRKLVDSGDSESLICGSAVNNIILSNPVSVPLTAEDGDYQIVECEPVFNKFDEDLVPGDTVSFYLAIDPELDDTVQVRSVSFRYAAAR